MRRASIKVGIHIEHDRTGRYLGQVITVSPHATVMRTDLGVMATYAETRKCEPPCHALKYNGTPITRGDHGPHLFTYGPGGRYSGSCKGRVAVDRSVPV